MGLRFHKSINLGGGIRVNLSTKGIGYSWGVKGFRLTKTADGRTRRTITIPGTGISYVDESNSKHKKVRSAPAQEENPLKNYSDIKEIKSAKVSDLRSAGYEELFKQYNMWMWIKFAAIVITVLSIKIPVLFWLCMIATFALFFVARIEIEYEFDDTEQKKWDELSAAWRGVAKSKVLKEVTKTATSKNAKVTAGISKAVDAVKMSSKGELPWDIKTNVTPVMFCFSNLKIAIMPDRLFVFSRGKIGALRYEDVNIEVSAVGFLEQDPVPSDAEVVQYAWAYANKDGSPDKRYADNKQFPIVKYGRITITSPSGLNVQFMCSNEAASDKLYHVLTPQ